MRVWLPALLAVALAALPLVPAQAPAPDSAGPLRVLVDAANDNDVSAGGVPAADSRWAGSDLLALDVQETPGGYAFTLTVRGLGEEDLPTVDGLSFDIGLRATDESYCMALFVDSDSAESRGGVGQLEPTFGRCATREQFGLTADVAAGTLAWTVSRQALLDSRGAALSRGDVLDQFVAHAVAQGADLASGLTEGAVTAQDRMPDTDIGTVPYPIQHAAARSGTVRIASPNPVRVSNGEATTVFFEAIVTNEADHADVLGLTSSSLPAGWVTTFPQAELRLEAGGEIKVPVLVTIPFVHDHGRLANFTVHAQSRSDPLSYADLELGVRYTAVPQPAGHHDTVFLHEAGNQLYINTLETDEIPVDEPSSGPTFGGGCSVGGSGNGGAMTELIPLVPGLNIGLDGDMERQGLARINLHAELPVVDGYSVAGFFLAWYGDERPETCMTTPSETTFAVINRSAPFSIDANSSITVELPIVPLAYGDYLPYQADISMALMLVLYEEGPGHMPGCCLGVEAPTYAPGSSFQLPLLEYHDPVDQFFSTLSGVDLLSKDGQQRLVNPGETAMFTLSLANIGVAQATFDLEMTGSNLAFATVLGDATVSLGPGESRDLGVAVAVPDGTDDGTLVDITLHAVNAGDANVRSLIRLLAEVDTEADHPDDSAAAGELDKALTSKESPGVAFAMLALGVLFVAARRRR